MAVTPVATVIVPTHTHGETLRYSIPTALAQTEPNLEIIIVGDGVPEVTRAIVAEFEAADPRVRFVDFPKGPNRGERYRHQVLEQARGRIVCYLFDDDLWLPQHVAVMCGLLRTADFAFTMPVLVQTDGTLRAEFVNLEVPVHRRLFTHPRSSTPSVPTAAAHTMALYRRLPFGWRTTPAGVAPDKYMWAQCLGVDGCVARGVSHPTTIIFPDPPRRSWTLAERLDELDRWSRDLHDETWQRQFTLDALHALAATADRYLQPFWWSYAMALGARRLGVPLIQWASRLTTPARSRR